VPGGASQPERVQVGGERLVAARRVHHAGQPVAHLGEPAQREQPVGAQQPPEHDGHRVDAVVVDPRDVMRGQRVKDGAGLGVVHHVPRQVVDEPVRGAGDEEPAVGEGWPQARAEPPVRDRERPRQPVVERQVGLGPVAHRNGRVAPGHLGVHAGREPVVGPVGVLGVAGVPGLRRIARRLLRGSEVMGGNPLSVRQDIDGTGGAIGAKRQPVAAPGEGAQVVVVGVVLLHEHDDVLDLGDEVGAGRQVGPGSRPERCPQCPPLDLPLLQLLPHRGKPPKPEGFQWQSWHRLAGKGGNRAEPAS
jgi:hypothetical protein